MIRKALVTAAVLAVLTGSMVTASASTDGNATVTRSANLQWWNMQEGRYGWVEFRTTIATDEAGQATLETVATAYIQICDINWTCTTASFPTQQVALTALQMDPLGNTVTMRASLNPQSGPAQMFDLRMDRPAHQGVSYGFPNVWADTDTNEVHVDEWAGLTRSTYVVSGVAGPQAFPVANTFANSYQNASATLTAGP